MAHAPINPVSPDTAIVVAEAIDDCETLELKSIMGNIGVNANRPIPMATASASALVIAGLVLIVGAFGLPAGNLPRQTVSSTKRET